MITSLEPRFVFVVATLAFTVGGFLLEFLSIWSKGARRGAGIFKLWLRSEGDKTLYSESYRDIERVVQCARSRKEHLVDVVRLASFEDSVGIGYDLCVSALIADVVAFLDIQSVSPIAVSVVFAMGLHFLFLVVMTMLAAGNQRMWPDQPGGKAVRRTCVVIGLGLLSAVIGYGVLWEVLV